MTLGQYVRMRRQELDLTQDQVAEAIGMSRKWVSKVEGDANDFTPSESHCNQLAHSLLVNADDLIRLTGRIPQDVLGYLVHEEGAIDKVRRMMGGKSV